MIDGLVIHAGITDVCLIITGDVVEYDWFSVLANFLSSSSCSFLKS